MADLIDNPVINSPFEEPRRHFRFADDGITDEILPGRRRSTYFIPIAQPKLKGAQKQAALDLSVQHRAEENQLINDLRARVSHWRQAGRPYTTAMTRRLLDYWTRPDRERRLFFCQIEAVETLIYCFSLFLTLPAWAETLTLANGQRCTVLSNGRLGGCTAPTNDRDRSDTRPQYPAYGRRDPTFAEPKTRQIAPAGWTPKY